MPKAMSEKLGSCGRISARVRCGCSGFTLLETLVALAIVAIGFAFAFAALPASLGAQDHARNLDAAVSIAHSLLDLPKPASHGEEGAFAWRIETSPLGNAAAAALRGQILRVVVQWQEGAKTRNIAVQSVRLRR
jgi:prepilin-type N-terminal cleavage/methylation domain-containing protein